MIRGIMRSALEWVDDHLEVIDQILLPGRLEMRKLTSSADVVDAIARMAIRGAPAIGVCGAFGVALGLRAGEDLDELVERVGNARPTGANLAACVHRVAIAARRASDPVSAALDEALRIQAEDIQACLRIGSFGREELPSARRILTHCNTGRLATAGIGTALGVVYAKAQAGEPIEVIVTESRPVMQGARLTAWELADAGIPVTLISDAAAGALLATDPPDAVVLGCDRVAANGDTANKIGTYGLAVLANAHDVPFYVAGPLSSFDVDTSDGDAIVVEQRPADEVRRIGEYAVAPDVDVWNPAFDVTPAELIVAFITDAGVLRAPFSASIREAMRHEARTSA